MARSGPRPWAPSTSSGSTWRPTNGSASTRPTTCRRTRSKARASTRSYRIPKTICGWPNSPWGILTPGLILVAGGLPNPALAQAWPSKPMRIVIAQAPGSATDVISRVVGNQLSESLGQPIVIDARPGAGGVLGTEVAARSAPDGYTLFMANNSTHGSNPAVYAKLPYDAIKDFAPISFVASVPYVLVVDPALPVKTVQEFIALAKSRPGR